MGEMISRSAYTAREPSAPASALLTRSASSVVALSLTTKSSAPRRSASMVSFWPESPDRTSASHFRPRLCSSRS